MIAENNHKIIKLLSIIKPKPSPYKLIRVGGNSDGSYLLPDDFSDIKACFSPGVNNIKGFEDELSIRYGIQCHLCDASSDLDALKTPLITGRQTFTKKWLNMSHTEESISLQKWVEEYVPNPQQDLILQMDIEGSEYLNILGTPDKVLNQFRILVIEFHHLEDMLIPEKLSEILLPTFLKIDQYFQCVHAHANNWRKGITIVETGMNIPPFLELTFLRKDRFLHKSTSNFYGVYIPHSADIVNINYKPPLHLNTAWLDGELPLISKIKKIKDWVFFIFFGPWFILRVKLIRLKKRIKNKVDSI